jgi:hypothetical protein
MVILTALIAGDKHQRIFSKWGMLQSDEMYQAMRNNPGLPNKDEFVQKLNAKLQARLSVRFSQTKGRGEQQRF